ncbi:MnhB domain-containing protein [Anaerosolibacter sp.]|uniref:MnhB domain-containing protein n=1 Tax=Anaerosolibacter sp. TaxID=1872527 RepID=UPI0039EE9D12
MKTSTILVYISKLLFPFMILFGLYIILNGDRSPGGGFQGGAVLATAYLVTYFFNPKGKVNLHRLIEYEKYIFLCIIFLGGISYFIKGDWFTNFIIISESLTKKRIFLILLNFLIGIKVALGLIGIVEIFIEEEKQ